jgi:hypothetical protein
MMRFLPQGRKGIFRKETLRNYAQYKLCDPLHIHCVFAFKILKTKKTK